MAETAERPLLANRSESEETVKMVQITEAEWKIMECLWDHAPQAMSEITKTLEPDTGWTRHTVITLLKRLADKGAVSVEDNGYVHLYTPLVTREESVTNETRKLVRRAFGGIRPC